MPYGKEAKEELVKLVQGRTLKISVYDTDRYGRLVGDVDCNGVFVQVWIQYLFFVLLEVIALSLWTVHFEVCILEITIGSTEISVLFGFVKQKLFSLATAYLR